jgi:hypothetical protein
MIDYSQLTPQQVDRFIHIQSIIGRQAADAARVRDLRAYYDGDHPVMLTRRQQEFLGPLLTETEFVFTHNLIKTVVDTLRERISVAGFTVNGESTNDEGSELPQLLWDWWTANRMDAQQNRLYKRVLRDGRSYVMVDYDTANSRPRFTLHNVDDGTVGITYHRDPSDPNSVLFANRYFYTFDPLNPGETGKLRKTTYLPHEIRKYVQSGLAGGWITITDDGDPSWPLPWRDRQGNPLGIAIVEFENPDGSEIAQIIGLQNGLNKSWLDLIAAADAAGFPILAAEYADAMADVANDDDDLEGADEFRVGPGRVIEIFGGKMHRIPSGDLSQLIDTIWTITSAISGASRTPQHYLRPVGGDVPSGEALKQLESGLVKRAEERQLVFGQGWEDAMKLALRVEDTFGQRLAIPQPLTIGTDWKPADLANPLVAAQTAQLHAGLGVPNDAVWGLLGYSPEEIGAFQATAQATRAAEVAAIAAQIRLGEARNIPQTGATNV